MYDAIVCDPPYGIRAGARKSGSKHKKKKGQEGEEEYVVKAVPEELRAAHIPQTQPYPVVCYSCY